MRFFTLLLLLTLTLSSCYYPRGWHMMDWGHGFWGYGGAFMWLIFLVLIGIIIYFVLRGDKLMKHGGEETAFDILKKRYAKGEITKQEYEKIKKDLQ